VKLTGKDKRMSEQLDLEDWTLEQRDTVAGQVATGLRRPSGAN